jgi:hypothetical protein
MPCVSDVLESNGKTCVSFADRNGISSEVSGTSINKIAKDNTKYFRSAVPV